MYLRLSHFFVVFYPDGTIGFAGLVEASAEIARAAAEASRLEQCGLENSI